MNDTEHRWRRKCFCICLLALFIGLIGIVLPEQEDIAFEYIVNNTDLYNNGRITGINYTANDSAIQLFLIFHVVGTGASLAVDTNLSINGTVVEDRDYRTDAGAGLHEHFSMTAHIPKGSRYNVTNSSNLETIEWREYPILTGKNGTLSINQTGGGTGSQNLSQVLTQGPNANFQGIVDLSDISTDGQLLIESTGGGIDTSYAIFDYANNILTLNAKHSNTYQNMIDIDANKTTFRRDVIMDNSSTNYTNTGKWLNVGYNSVSGLMEVNTSSIFYYKQGNTFLGFTGSGFAYSAYSNRPMKFGEAAANNSAIQYNVTHGTRWQGSSTGGANNNLNITGFDSVNMYQNLNVTGRLNMTSDNWPIRVSLMDGNGIFTAYNQSIIRTQLSSTGIQEWKLKNATHETGFILYSAPGSPGSVGIIYRNATQGQRTQISLRPYESGGGLELYSSDTSGGATNLTRILDQRNGGTVQVDALAGTGNAYVCVDSTGKLYRGNPGC